MRSIADQLPPEVARQLHPDRRKNEAAYWAARDQLLGPYQGQWVGFADGKVIASGRSPVSVLHAAEASGLHPFFICVGKEEEPCRIRRASFPYDTSYPGEALPLVSVEFRSASGSAGIALDRVIPDTGADASVLPWADCLALPLSPAQGVQSLLGGVTRLPGLGTTRRTRQPVPAPGRFRRQRAHLGARRAEPFGDPVPRPGR